jgi:hypothetical protein
MDLLASGFQCFLVSQLLLTCNMGNHSAVMKSRSENALLTASGFSDARRQSRSFYDHVGLLGTDAVAIGDGVGETWTLPSKVNGRIGPATQL